MGVDQAPIENARVRDHYDAAPQRYPEIASDKLSSLECRTFQLFVSLYDRAATIVDVGCGTGRVGRYLHARLGPPLVVYFELSDRSLRLARDFESPESRVRCAFVRGDLLNLPLKGLLFCASHGVVHHTPAPRQALSQLAIALAPGGVLYLAIYARSWYAVVYRLFGILRWARRSRSEWLVQFAYGIYWPLRWMLRVRESGRLSRDFNIRASFEDFVMTPHAHFFSDAAIGKLFVDLNLEIIDHEYLNYGLLHSYVLRKRS